MSLRNFVASRTALDNPRGDVIRYTAQDAEMDDDFPTAEQFAAYIALQFRGSEPHYKEALKLWNEHRMIMAAYL